MSVTLRDKRPSYFKVHIWVARFRTGHLSTEDERSDRRTQVAIPEYVDVSHSMILNDWRKSSKKIPETLTTISRDE
jgi:hypothetical protein